MWQEGLEAEAEGHAGEERQEWCLFLGQVLSWTEQEGRLGSTQPWASNHVREQAPAQALLQSQGPVSDWNPMGKGWEEHAQGRGE